MPKALTTVPYKAFDVLLKCTYRIDTDGRRHCLRCGAMQYDYPSGHKPGCEVDEALRLTLGEGDAS